MKIIQKQILTNNEFLKEINSLNLKEKNIYTSNLEKITNEKKIFKNLENFELTIEEKIQIINNQPINPMKLFLICNNLNTRFSNDQINKILEC